MKRIIHTMLMIILCSFVFKIALAIENPVFTVSITGTIDTGKTFNDQSTLVLSWQIMANSEGMVLSNAQGLRLAYDNTVLHLMGWDGSDAIDDNVITTSYTFVPNAGFVGVYGDDVRVFVAKDNSSALGYINLSLGDVYETYSCSQGENVLLAQIRFAFRAGKTVDDLNVNTIRCQNINELHATAQSSAILLNTDDNDTGSYEYLRQSNDEALGGDKLNAPIFSYPGSEIKVEGQGELPEDTMETSEPIVTNETAEQDETAAPGLSDNEIHDVDTPTVVETYTPGESVYPNETNDSTESAVSDNIASPDETTSVNDQESNSIWLYMILIGVVFLAVLFMVLILRKQKRKVLPSSDKSRTNQDGDST
ncbi:MAG: hypothetical protein FWH57_03345 [Oscillospiraceae bacterium]|nr:hypothetical protein [Oscillospiraceae bacterium]